MLTLHFELCNAGQVPYPLWALASSSVKWVQKEYPSHRVPVHFKGADVHVILVFACNKIILWVFRAIYRKSNTHSKAAMSFSRPTAQVGELRLWGNRRFQVLGIKEETPDVPLLASAYSGLSGLRFWT